MKAIKSKLHYFRRAAIALFAFFVISFMLSPKSEHSIRASVVRIDGAKGGMCSGEQIKAPSGQLYILTAAHCRGLGDGGMFQVTTEDHRKLLRREIQEDVNSDLLLLEGIPGLPALDISDSYSSKGLHVRTFTHGARMDTYKTEGELIMFQNIMVPIQVIADQKDLDYCLSMPKYRVETLESFFSEPMRYCILDIREVAMTARIVPGSSGGSVVDDNGDLIGVVSAGDGSNLFGYIVSVEDIRRFLKSY